MRDRVEAMRDVLDNVRTPRLRVLWRSEVYAGTARRRGSSVFHSAQSRLYFMPPGTQGRCAIVAQPNAQALVFIAAAVLHGVLERDDATAA